VKETCTFKTKEAFGKISEHLYKTESVILQLAEISGKRWSYIAGRKPESYPFCEQRRLNDRYGIILYSRSSIDNKNKEMLFNKIKDSVFLSDKKPEFLLSKKEIVGFLETKNEDKISNLFKRADKIRKENVGDEVHIRGIIEASNYCIKNCFYCGLRKDNKNIKRYRLTEAEIYDACKNAYSFNYKTVVIQTGEAAVYKIEDLCRLVSKVKKDFGLAITLSLGELDYDSLRSLKNAGADRYLVRFETSDRNLFRKVKPDSDYDKRFLMLKWLRELNYQVGSGIMVGLPGQSIDSIAEDIMLFGRIGLDMVGSGPFIANPDTPLSNSVGGDLLLSLKLIALTRIITLNAHIPATTALGTIDGLGRQKGLASGANVIMPNVTPHKYRKDYLLYPNKICINEKPSDCSSCISSMIFSAGRKIAEGYGHSLKSKIN